MHREPAMVVRLVVMLVDAAPAATMAAECVVSGDENAVSALGPDAMVRLMFLLGTLGARRL